MQPQCRGKGTNVLYPKVASVVAPPHYKMQYAAASQMENCIGFDPLKHICVKFVSRGNKI